MQVDGSISQLKGVGDKRKKKFEQIKIMTVLDLLYYFPRDYEDLSQVKTFQKVGLGEKALIKVELQSKFHVNRQLFKIKVIDQDGLLGEIAFFSQAYLFSKLKEGSSYYLYGEVKIFRGTYQLTNPRVYTSWQFKTVQGIRAIYPQQKGLKQFEIEKLIHQALENLEDLEEVPEEFFWIINIEAFREEAIVKLLKKYRL